MITTMIDLRHVMWQKEDTVCLCKKGGCLLLRFFGFFSWRIGSISLVWFFQDLGQKLCFPSDADTVALQFAYQIAELVLWISQSVGTVNRLFI